MPTVIGSSWQEAGFAKSGTLVALQDTLGPMLPFNLRGCCTVAFPEAALRKVIQYNSGETLQHYEMTLPLAAPKFSPGLT